METTGIPNLCYTDPPYLRTWNVRNDSEKDDPLEAHFFLRSPHRETSTRSRSSDVVDILRRRSLFTGADGVRVIEYV